uniref:Putative ATPase (AAA+ superfamily) n=1 Tax=uncultured bacterium contig00092 TaxID=1181563 RepID=A0A806KHW8_9BACT|nr:putative ATPase (AAA+ superfamily) [uncultured bacterium contig00092]
MKRTLASKLAEWKNSASRKPLIIKGVRQCGKTYLLKEFGKNYYEDFACFNFEGNEILKNVFENDFNTERIITELSVIRKKAIFPQKTLIIFDEIQFCNRALTSLKYFCEEAPEYHIAAAGSLLGIALSKPLSFPVGKVDFHTLYPMSFYEFLLANGEDLLCGQLENLPAAEPVPAAFAAKLEDYLKNYYMCGGMPEAVNNWVSEKNIEKLDAILQKILDSYELDFAKHAPANEFPKLSAIWHSIPAQLARENGKFIFSHVKRSLRAKDLEDALEWLVSAGMVYKVAKIEKPFMPISTYADYSFFKLYMADIGLLRRISKLPAAAFLESSDVFKEFKGVVTENFVLCELVNKSGEVPFFWKSGNTAEVDFIIQSGMDIVPVEVKSANKVRARSLAEYVKKYSPSRIIITSLKNAGGNHIPLYILWR